MSQANNSQDDFIEIRCPFQLKDKYGITHTCNRVCVKVSPGSSGEAWCRQCRKSFEFTVDNQNDASSYHLTQRFKEGVE